MTYSNMLTRRLFDMLSPLIGETIAQAALKVQAQKLGVPEESFSKRDLPELALGIEKGLAVFIGSETARRVSSQIEHIRVV